MHNACLPANWLACKLAGMTTNNLVGMMIFYLASLPTSRYSNCMMIVLANSKGGVGKSTLAVHLATWLHDQGFRTACIDCDKQRSSSQWLAEVEPKITLAVAETPETCLSEAQGLLQSHDFVVGDAPAGLDDISRTLLILSDLALLPISPSLLDLRSVQQATGILRYAQQINGGTPVGKIILNKMRTRDTISRELQSAAPNLGVEVATTVIRDLQAFRDAAQQGSVVTRMGRKTNAAAQDIEQLFEELIPESVRTELKNRIGDNKEVING
jgi:chromosome partitioning protein